MNHDVLVPTRAFMETDTWAEMCNRARYTATDSRLVPLFPWAADLVDRLTARFCGLATPQDGNELAVRKQEERGMIAIRTALLFANEWAKLTTPAGVATIAHECQKMAALDFPTCEGDQPKLDSEIKKTQTIIQNF